MQLVEVFILAIHLFLVGIGACLPLAVVLLNRKMLRIDNSGHCDAIWQFSRSLMKASIQALILGSIFGLLLAAVLWSEDFHHRCLCDHHLLNFRMWLPCRCGGSSGHSLDGGAGNKRRSL